MKKEGVVQLFVKLESCVIEVPPRSDEKISEDSVLSITRLRTKYKIPLCTVLYSSYESDVEGVILFGVPPVTEIKNRLAELVSFFSVNIIFSPSELNEGEDISLVVSYKVILFPTVS